MNINFTIENESNGSLAFLDVEISRLDVLLKMAEVKAETFSYE